MKPSLRGSHKGILLAIIILSLFFFFVFAVLFSYQTALETKVMSPLVSPLVKYHVYFMVSLTAIGVAIGASVFYFMSQKVQSTQVVAKRSAEVLLRFLSKEEQQVVKKLVAENGRVLQAELSREQGLNKVKVHRILQKLNEKQIISVEGYGKTNTVHLQHEIYEALT
jgi:hypothetical protein